MLRKDNCTHLFPSILSLLFLMGCQVPEPSDRDSAESASDISVLSHVVEVDRVRWALGALEAETVFINMDGSPAYKTTVVNASDQDIWWPGLRTGTIRSRYKTAIEPDWSQEGAVGGGGGYSGIGDYARRAKGFNPKKNIDYLMRPGAKRVFEKSMKKVKDGFVYTFWSFKGETNHPSVSPLSDYPPYDVPLSFEWKEEEGCTVIVAGNEKRNP